MTTEEIVSDKEIRSGRKQILVFAALILLAAALLYTYIVGLQLHTGKDISWFIKLALLQSVLFAVAAALIIKTNPSRLCFYTVILLAFLFRLSILFSPPALSDDAYRYVWDGKVQASGINPYRYIPAEPALSGLRDDTIYPKINRKDYARTIYPPFAQFFFLLATRLGYSIIRWKIALAIVELLTFWSLLRLLDEFSLPRQWLIVYAWHPLIIWHFAGSGHIDSLAISLIVTSVLATVRGRSGLAGFLLGCATLVKFYPIVLFPALYKRWDLKMPAALAGTIGLLYLPYLGVGFRTALGFLPQYADEEGIRNGSRFFLLNLAHRIPGTGWFEDPLYKALAILLLLIAAIAILYCRKARKLTIAKSAALMTVLFTALLSPRYAWYFTWVIPFIVFVPALSLFYLTLSCFLLYGLWMDDSATSLFRINALIYIPFMLLLLGEIAYSFRAGRFKSDTRNVVRNPGIRDTGSVENALTANEQTVSVVIPALNEEDSISDVVSSIPRYLIAEVIVVDNGSTDRTAERATLAGARVVSEPRRGYGRACQAGVNSVDSGCRIVAFLDGDGSDAPEFMEAIAGPILRDEYDFVIGSRVRGHREKGSMNFQQRFAGWTAGLLINAFYGVRYTDMCPFRAIKLDELKKLRMEELTFGWNLEMQMKAARAGLRILEVPVDHRCRTGGESKVSGNLSGTLRAGFRIAATFLRVATSRIGEDAELIKEAID